MLSRRTLAIRRAGQRGLSLVELMVGVAVGLFIVAGAALLASSQLAENRRLLLETQVQQDLRAAADIITHELRRAGYRTVPEQFVWSAASPAAQPAPNTYAGLSSPLTSGDVVSYRYERLGAASLDFGYQWVGTAIRQRIGATAPQDLTDSSTLMITDFRVDLTALPAQPLACPRLCSDGTPDCWPTTQIVDAVVTITGQAVSDANVQRTVTSRVRLPNDSVRFNVSATQVCP